jgi:S-adenosylmethionine:tRNA ribosyltransferase-isomerase
MYCFHQPSYFNIILFFKTAIIIFATQFPFMNLNDIDIKDYNYNLPQERIAQFPLDKRDNSKLLIFNDGEIKTDAFYNINFHIPNKSLLIFNNTKVIPARILFKKDTGAAIEIFCLDPYDAIDHQVAMTQKVSCEWKCFIGNSKKWKDGKVKCQINKSDNVFLITAEKVKQIEDAWIVRFEWEPCELSFSEVLEITGHTPLPPYINRNDDENDRERYQTIYALHKGSVAAPTAGLHFTEEVFTTLSIKGVTREYITLHVGAGTFKPVSTSIEKHIMHTEPFIIKKEFLITLLNNLENAIIPVGTTSVRTLESIYWLGVKLIIDSRKDFVFTVGQWDPYNEKYNIGINPKEVLQALINFMDENKTEIIAASTQLMILPSYKFVFPKGIITNFHQPQSTLLLLISAFTGVAWKNIYDYALKNGFRFLSYGDSSLLWKI